MVRYDLQDGIALLRLDHGKANTIDPELCGQIAEALDRAYKARAVVLTGSGAFFSAGVDLFRIMNEAPDFIDDFLPAMNGIFERIFTHPAPVVAAINGHAIAGGCLLAAGADRRLMADGPGRIGTPELRLGVPFPPGALEIMRSITASQHFRTIVLGADTHLPAQALALGLVDEVVPPDTLSERSLALAESMIFGDGSAFATVKHEVRRPAIDAIRHREKEVGATIHAMWKSEGTRASIRAYLDRTLAKS
ncbi:enoyl-CoA hydratase/isomerase family protein [Thioalkalivibrio sp. HK1]|uniref:enoyl-CoA hydratase/isomerase family protein n=1 Tax=Thioalkalivibrio sp. HK1 TaxID=1469245 RepID=UPI00047115EF|nr:enoyl-CoA hydratase/isomerase family protein [Thioalkalivibrio sp. HK1]